MKKPSQNQAGFSLVEGLLLIIAVAIVAFVGYYVYRAQKAANQTLNSATKVAQSSPGQGSVKKVSSTTSTSSAASQELKIPELGVQVKLSGNITTAYYAMSSSDQTIAYLSLHSWTTIDSQCSPTKTSTAALSYFTNPDTSFAAYPGDNSGTTYSQAYPNATKINGKYFYIIPGNGSCSSNAQITSEQSKAQSDFSNAQISALN